MAGVDDVKHFASLGLQSSSQQTSCGSEVFSHHRIVPGSGPILVLIHGYPQSSFMWRHVVSILPASISLFIPDVPGYGRSTPSKSGDDKRTIGNAILQALESVIGADVGRAIILGGHDRGARICHRLAVDHDSNRLDKSIKGVILLDIVPTIVQWGSFANSRNSTSTFHWPFLANVDLATTMIKQYGGDKWCRDNILRWAGQGQEGLQSLKSDKAVELYSEYFSKESVIRASCEDYRAGSAEDVDQQEEDQRLNKKLVLDTLVSYSSKYLGSRYNLSDVWKDWHNGPPEALRIEGLDGGVGHFVAEEAPREISALITTFYNDVSKKL